MTFERCSCNAAIFTFRHSRVAEWRANHQHEMPEESADQPMIHESGSSHERLGDEYPVLDRARPAGFRAND